MDRFSSSMHVCVTCVYLALLLFSFFFFKQKTAYEMRISDWSSDVCSSDLQGALPPRRAASPPDGLHWRDRHAPASWRSASPSARRSSKARRTDRKSVV